MTDRDAGESHPHRADVPERPEAEQRDYVSQALVRARDAVARTGAVEHRIFVAGSRIALTFAGAALADQFMPALAHLTDRSAMCPPISRC